MTTLRQIITDAYRESGLIAVGAVPEAEEHEEGLRRLQTLIRSVLGLELGEGFVSLLYGSYNLPTSAAANQDIQPYVAGKFVEGNVRLIVNINETDTVYLTPRPQDGMRFSIIDRAGTFATSNLILSGNGYNIEDAASVTLNTNSVNREWFYRADLGSWKRVTELTASDEVPFPTEFDDFLVIMLAMRINPRYGSEMSAQSIEMLKRSQTQFRARYRQNMPTRVDAGIYRLPSNYYYNEYAIGDTSNLFNYGIT